MKPNRLIENAATGANQGELENPGLLININALASRYGVSVRAIYYWMDAQRISHYRIGHTLRFSPAETDEELKKIRIPARGF